MAFGDFVHPRQPGMELCNLMLLINEVYVHFYRRRRIGFEWLLNVVHRNKHYLLEKA